jgi:hypothetical protein
MTAQSPRSDQATGLVTPSWSRVGVGGGND